MSNEDVTKKSMRDAINRLRGGDENEIVMIAMPGDTGRYVRRKDVGTGDRIITSATKRERAIENRVMDEEDAEQQCLGHGLFTGTNIPISDALFAHACHDHSYGRMVYAKTKDRQLATKYEKIGTAVAVTVLTLAGLMVPSVVGMIIFGVLALAVAVVMLPRLTSPKSDAQEVEPLVYLNQAAVDTIEAVTGKSYAELLEPVLTRERVLDKLRVINDIHNTDASITERDLATVRVAATLNDVVAGIDARDEFQIEERKKIQQTGNEYVRSLAENEERFR